MRPLPQPIKLEDSQRQVLEQWVRAHSTPQQWLSAAKSLCKALKENQIRLLLGS
jgi:hypothetical protein